MQQHYSTARLTDPFLANYDNYEHTEKKLIKSNPFMYIPKTISQQGMKIFPIPHYPVLQNAIKSRGRDAILKSSQGPGSLKKIFNQSANIHQKITSQQKQNKTINNQTSKEDMRTEPSMIGFTTTASVKTANVEYFFIIEDGSRERK
jgi:hypothetical protein